MEPSRRPGMERRSSFLKRYNAALVWAEVVGPRPIQMIRRVQENKKKYLYAQQQEMWTVFLHT